MTPRFPTSLRGRLTLVLALGSLVLVTVLIGGFNIVLRQQTRSDLDARLKERASAALANVLVRGGKVAVREAPGDEAIDQQVWVFDRGRLIESPPEPARAMPAARAAASDPGHFAEAPPLDLRLYSTPLARHGRTIGAVVAGASLAPYEATSRRAIVASIVLGLLIMAAVVVAGLAAVNAALRPVGRMTVEARAWSVEDLDHRFADSGTHDELAQLGSTFNDLLGRLAASFRHEQRFSAEVSHELRTPLARLIFEAELALRRERRPDDYKRALESIVVDARQMQRVIETLLAVARSEIDPRSGTADASAIAAAVAASLETPLDRSVKLAVVRSPAPVRVGVDAEVAERVLAPVVANALRFAEHRAVVEVREVDSTVRFVVRDDGPGVPEGEREAIFTPGYRGSTNGHHGESIGLGLALARRLARASDGDIVCDEAGNGAAFIVSLPSA
ncbi:MAG TPA: ATP-binding protein [Thermoleophilaceae bacterium]|nr:ATP-binding protein [Thermoleophilaceae bacterium]